MKQARLDAAESRSKIHAVNGSHATLVLDEAEAYINPEDKFGGDKELMACINAGVQRGFPALLCNQNNEPVLLDAFGYKIIASRKDIFETIADRSIQIILPKSIKRYPKLTEKDAREIRAKLAQYRIDCLSRKQPLRFQVVTKHVRLPDVLEPLFAITPEKHSPLLERSKKKRPAAKE